MSHEEDSWTPDNLLETETSIIFFTRFAEFVVLSCDKCEVKKDRTIYKLDSFLEDGLLRVGKRLNKAAMPEEAKHPVILSKYQHVSALILKHIQTCRLMEKFEMSDGFFQNCRLWRKY